MQLSPYPLRSGPILPCFAGNPLFALGGISLAPAINADIVVTFSLDSDGNIFYAASGVHDGFPAYELYINQQLVNSWDPVAQGKSPFALFPFNDVTVNVPPTILFSSINTG